MSGMIARNSLLWHTIENPVHDIENVVCVEKVLVIY